MPDAGHRIIRTFHARHGRMSDDARADLARLCAGRGFDDRELDDHASTRPLVLEIGCGFGHAALAFADAHPDVDVLAMDVHKPGMLRLVRELERAPRPNVWVEVGDAVELLADRVATGSLAGIHAFFPDPWPKARHHKRRLLRPDLADLFADRVAGGGVLRFATDVADYAAQAFEVLDGHDGWRVRSRERPPWRPVAGYAARAAEAGRTVVDLTAVRERSDRDGHPPWSVPSSHGSVQSPQASPGGIA